MGFIWDLYGIYMGFIWDLYGIYWGIKKNIYNIYVCMLYVCYMYIYICIYVTHFFFLAAEIFLVPAPCTVLSKLDRLIVWHHGSTIDHGTVPNEF